MIRAFELYSNMIISHKHKFIFIKPKKVAGTSVQVALASHCGRSDVISAITDYSNKWDVQYYQNPAQNNQSIRSHILPMEIKAIVGDNIWKNYFKITIVRNPWDVVVSRYNWKKRHDLSIKVILYAIKYNTLHLLFPGKYQRIILANLMSFKSFVRKLNTEHGNTSYYFGSDGQLLCDYYIRYEYLQDDYDSLCDRLKLPKDRLPKLKKTGNSNRNYRDYYDKETRKLVYEMYQKQIDYFNYTF